MAHAKLSASGAHRWLKCPGSVALEANTPNTTSEFAEEGTFAHDVVERLLTGKPINKDSKWYSEELMEYVEKHIDYVEERKAEMYPCAMNVEVRLDMSDIIPGGFGTADTILVNDNKLIVIDLKYGKGVKVDAFENPQLMLYAYGAYKALDFLYDFDTVEVVISQPRLDHISSFEISLKNLVAWAENYVKPRAAYVLSKEGEKDFNPDSTRCKFCKARAFCKVRAESMLDVINKFDFDSPSVLSKADVSFILDHSKDISSWLTEVSEYAFNALEDGEDIPGYKLVEGRSNRKITDEIKASKLLQAEGYTVDEFTQTKLLGITGLEKLLGKKRFNELLGEIVEKPQGKPVLATESDKRPKLSNNLTVDDFKDFE